jgi:hypothetical protein
VPLATKTYYQIALEAIGRQRRALKWDANIAREMELESPPYFAQRALEKDERLKEAQEYFDNIISEMEKQDGN